MFFAFFDFNNRAFATLEGIVDLPSYVFWYCWFLVFFLSLVGVLVSTGFGPLFLHFSFRFFGSRVSGAEWSLGFGFSGSRMTPFRVPHVFLFGRGMKKAGKTGVQLVDARLRARLRDESAGRAAPVLSDWRGSPSFSVPFRPSVSHDSIKKAVEEVESSRSNPLEFAWKVKKWVRELAPGYEFTGVVAPGVYEIIGGADRKGSSLELGTGSRKISNYPHAMEEPTSSGSPSDQVFPNLKFSSKELLLASFSSYRALCNQEALGRSILSHFLRVEMGTNERGEPCLYVFHLTSSEFRRLFSSLEGKKGDENLASWIRYIETLKGSDSVIASNFSNLEKRFSLMQIIRGLIVGTSRVGIRRDDGKFFASMPIKISPSGVILDSLKSNPEGRTQCVGSVCTIIEEGSRNYPNLAYFVMREGAKGGPDLLFGGKPFRKALGFHSQIMEGLGYGAEVSEADHCVSSLRGSPSSFPPSWPSMEWLEMNIRLAIEFEEFERSAPVPETVSLLGKEGGANLTLQYQQAKGLREWDRVVQNANRKKGGGINGDDGKSHLCHALSPDLHFLTSGGPSFFWPAFLDSFSLESYLSGGAWGVSSLLVDVFCAGVFFSFTALLLSLLVGPELGQLWVEHYASFFPGGRPQPILGHIGACWFAGLNFFLGLVGVEFRFPSWPGVEQPTLSLVCDNVLGVMLGDPVRWAVLLCAAVLIFIPFRDYLRATLKKKYPVGYRLALFFVSFSLGVPILAAKLQPGSLMALTSQELGLAGVVLFLGLRRGFVRYRKWEKARKEAALVKRSCRIVFRPCKPKKI